MLMEAKEIQKLLDFISKSDLNEVKIETEDFKVSVRKNIEPKTTIIEKPAVVQQIPATVPVQASVAEPVSQPTDQGLTPSISAKEENYVPIKSPMIGTFYRSPNPDADVFVKPGDKIEAGQTVCIIEAMKLFNEIESDISGTIVKVMVDDSSPVEFDQPLFLIDPS